MESNWRQGVHAAGLDQLGIRLAARLLGGGFFLVTDSGGIPGIYYVWVLSPANLQVTGTRFTFAIPAAHPHYPYGRAVTPD